MSNIDENIRMAASEETSQIDNILNATQKAEMAAAARSLYELYLNYVNVGFTP